MSARDPDAWMWAEACAMLERAERMRRQYYRPAARPVAWEPPLDLLETEGELWIIAALPGVAAEAVEIAIEDGVVVVRGERRLPALLRHARIHRLEIPHGRFERRIALPAGRFELRERALRDGCLVLGLIKLP
jgi:HSP20 family protein